MARTLLIEDKGSGQELIQTLRSEQNLGVPLPIPRTPTMDKLSRAQGVSSMVEAGQLFLPREAHWLGEFKSELLGFPNARHDDQVDALTQLLDWVRSRWSMQSAWPSGGTVFSLEADGSVMAYGDDADILNEHGINAFDNDPWGAL